MKFTVTSECTPQEFVEVLTGLTKNNVEDGQDLVKWFVDKNQEAFTQQAQNPVDSMEDVVNSVFEPLSASLEQFMGKDKTIAFEDALANNPFVKAFFKELDNSPKQ